MTPPKSSPRLVVRVDLKKKPREQKYPLHNRWHPDIPPVAEVGEGEVFRVEMVDFSGGGIGCNDSADDVKFVNPSIISLLLAMAPSPPKLVIPVDLRKGPREQRLPLHNRWHPLIPPVATVHEGKLLRIEMVDWTGGHIGDNDSAADVKSIDLSTVSFSS